MKAEWEEIESNVGQMLRLEVPGGWLVCLSHTFTEEEPHSGNPQSGHSGLIFYPDPRHEWKEQRE